MPDNTRLWSAQLRHDQNDAMKEILEEEDLTKSQLMKQSVDTYLDERNSNDLNSYEDAALDAAVFSAIGTIATTAAAAFGLVAWVPGLQLAGVLAVTAVVSVFTVQQGVFRGDE
jgi:hypothetical protein